MWCCLQITYLSAPSAISSHVCSGSPLAYWPLDHDDVIKWKQFPRYWPFVRGIHRAPVNSPPQRPVTRGFDVFFDLHLNKRLSKQSRCRWFETPSCSLWRHCNTKWLFSFRQPFQRSRLVIEINDKNRMNYIVICRTTLFKFCIYMS